MTFHKQGGFTPSASSESTPAEPPKPAWTPAAPRKPTSSKAMKLGGNARDVDSFVDQLESEGVKVGSVGAPVKTTGCLNKVLRFSILLNTLYDPPKYINVSTLTECRIIFINYSLARLPVCQLRLFMSLWRRKS